ncbi:retrovirus-related pol polyprotein from transposon TNT 1-94 [Tanacetum coccineum]
MDSKILKDGGEDLEPLSPKLRKNREARVNYRNVTKENADTLRDLVEQARALKPSDNALDYACMYAKQIQELLVYVSATCPSSRNDSEKFVAVTPINRNKQFTFEKHSDTYENNTQKRVDSHKTQNTNKPLLPSTRVNSFTNASGSKPRSNTRNNWISRPSSSNQKNKKVEVHPKNVKSSLNKTNRVSICNANVKHANSEFVCSTCNECLFSASHDMCVVDYFNDVNARARAKSKSIKNKEWKPTGKVFTTVGHIWLPTGRASTIHINFVSKFMGTIRFGNDQVVAIMGYGDYQFRNVTISRVYYVEGLGHNLFPVGQFCDSKLEVAFQKHSCFVCDLDGVDLLKGSQGSNLYTISLEDMLKSSPICLLSKASKTKSWLWHRRLSHLNFGTITQLAKEGLVRGLPKLKYEKDHLCSACSLRKSKKYSHKPKFENNIQEKLYLHMDLCGPMRVESINGKKYILVIVDNYSRFTWVKFLRSKDETPEFTLKSYYEDVRISHQTSVGRNPQQNGIVERRTRILVGFARTMLIFSKAPLFLLAEVVATACYTQNRSLIWTRHKKTPYELLYDRKPDLKYLRIFGALCYPTNDSEDLGKLKPKANIGIFIGYSPAKKAYQIYNKRTRKITETIHVKFDELTTMASE